MSEFAKRTLTGAVFIVVVLGAVMGGAWPFFILLFIVNLLGLYEYAGMFKQSEFVPDSITTLLCGAGVFTLFALFFMDVLSAAYLFIALPFTQILFIAELFNSKGTGFRAAALGIGGIAYISVPLSLFIYIVHQGGEYAFLLPLGYFLLLWSSDTFAYITGRALGRTKLFPVISPKKTWEGAIGGLVCTAGVAVLLSYQTDIMSLAAWAGLACIIVIAGSIGDLVESMLKRNLGIKDSGAILPGHGGILDRFDSLLFSLPFAAAYLQFINI